MSALLLALALAQAQPKEVTIVGPRNSIHCDHLRTDAKFSVRLRNAELANTFQTIADATCFIFELEKGLKAKVSIRPNENEPKSELTANELLRAVIADLERQGVSVKEESTRRYRVSAVR